MAKWVAADVLDQTLSMIASASRMLATVGQPADYAGALSAALAGTPMEAGDFSLGAVGGGRRVNVAAKSGVPVTAQGTADHVALVNDGSSRLLYVTTCPPQLLETGGTVNIDGWDVEIGAPV